MQHSWRLVVITLGLIVGGCAAEAKAPDHPKPAQVAVKKQKKPARAKPLSAEQIRRAMNKKGSELSGCYELSNDKDDSALGSVTVEFEVDVDGNVNGERISDGDDFGDDVLRDCILRVVRETRFPKAKSATDVSWPLRFRSASH